jgi:hypothetical protein
LVYAGFQFIHGLVYSGFSLDRFHCITIYYVLIYAGLIICIP